VADPLDIPSVVSELESAGLLGGVAIGMLAPFLGGTPGTAVSTSTGFVWTKTLLSGEEGTTVGLGALGRLKLDSGAIGVTLGVNWYGSRPEVDILFQLNDGQALTLQVNESFLQVADRIAAPGENGPVIGYDRSTLGPVEIPLPSLALEFSFRPGLGDGVAASLQAYHPGSGQGADGIFEWTPAADKLLVFRKFFDIAFGVQKLFIDLSATNGVADFKSRFAEVYAASWKGIGAQRIDLVVPVEDKFFNATAEGFLVDFEGRFTGDFSLSFQNPTGKVLKAIDAEISLRENDPRRGEVGVTVDLNGVKDAADTPAAAASTASPSTAETARVDRAKEEFALRKADLDFDGQVRFSGALTYGVLGEGTALEQTVYALDLTGASVKDGQGNTIHGFEGAGAVAVLWTVTALIGVPLFIRGAQREDASDALMALGLVFLAIVVGDEVSGSTPTFLPRLTRLNLNAVKLRYVHVIAEQTLSGGETSHYTQRLVEVGLDLGAVFSMDCRLTDLIDKLLSVAITVGSNLVGLFGSALESAEISGNLELEFGNMFLRFRHTEAHRSETGPVEAAFDIFPPIDEGLARLLKERSPVITARQIPDIKLVASEGGSAIPRPVTEIKAVRVGEGEALRRGVSIALSGLGNGSMTIATPAAGVVIFWSPEFSIEPMAQLQKNPEFSFLMPPLAYARGVIDIGKPLPSIGGEQSRIAVDVGIRNKEVKAGKALSADDQKKLRDFKNYEWAFGGEIVWGDATGGPDAESFSFLFVEVHYEGKTPLFSLGPVGFYGLGGLFGHNIAPGIAPNQQSAVGIANWIFGDGKGAFTAVKDWPTGEPTPATWHPDRDFEHDKDRYAFGLFVKVGSVGDGGKSVSVDGIVMIGFPEFWLAIAGFAIIKQINAELTVIIVYDHPSRGFVVKVAFNYKIDKTNGRIVDMKNRLEIGTVREPKRRWIYFGHYADDKGGPGAAKLFKLLNVKFYVVYDTQGTDQFGIVLVESPDVKPPAIPGPVFGFGALFQFGPKSYGPSWLNISLFAGLGFNVAVAPDPFLIYGDLYAVGHVQVKIAVFKGKLGFSARLYGVSSEEFHVFSGKVEVRINLPWPLSDIHKSFDFVLEDGVPAFPPPVISSTASALSRVEPRSIELGTDQTQRVPIDSVIAVSFDKPIFEVQAVTAGNTQLTINDPQLPNFGPEPVETLTTEFVDRKYEIVLKHVMRYVRVERRPLAPDGGPSNAPWVLVSEMAAAWEPPDDLADDGTPEPGSEPHHVLYLNTFAAPELQFSQTALEKHYNWTEGAGTVPPCVIDERVCLLGIDPPIAAIDTSRTLWNVVFNSAQGSARIAERRWDATSYGGLPRNLNRLSWVEGELDLPELVAIGLPDADEVDLVLRFGALRPANPPLLKRMDAVVAVKLRGVGVALRVRLSAVVDPSSPCSFRLDATALEHDDALITFSAGVERCQGGIHETALRLTLVAHDYVHLIDEVTIEGPLLVWDDAKVAGSPHEQLGAVFDRLQKSLLYRLEQVCFRRSRTSRVHWQNSLLAVDADGQTGPGALWDNMLLVPDSDYQIHYGLTSFASRRVENDDPDEPNEVDERPAADSESGDDPDATLKTVRFRTEASPTQDPERYVGLTWPAVRDGSASPHYPDHFRPFLTLRNDGLLRKIHTRHAGAEVLRSEIVDIHGVPLAPQIVDTINIGSSPLDDTFESVVSQCLPDAQQLSWARLDIWQAQLATKSAYSLQLTDLRDGATSPHWGRSLRTSAFATFAAHTAYVEALVAEAGVLPVVDAGAAPEVLAAAIGAARAGSAPGRDGLVEALYRNLLGVDGGSLRRHFGAPGADFAGHIVGRQDDGPCVWGVVLELDEPLVGRDGVSLPNRTAPDAEALAERGLQFVDEAGLPLLLVADTAGTRVIVFRSPDGVSFTPFEADAPLSLRFAPGDELTALARRYVEATSRPLGAAEFQAKFDALMQTVTAHPDLGMNFAAHDAALTFAVPPDLTSPG
jgi:hypothetical protein